MNKRALMMTAAAVALLSGNAHADTDVTTATTTALSTSTAGNITIEANGSITIKAASPVVTINSSKTLLNKGTISNKDTTSAVGVKIDLSSASLTGSLENDDVIDLTGTGTNKIGVLLVGANAFNGNLLFVANSKVTVTGDNSVGLEIASTSILNGNLTINGNITALSATTTAATNPTAIRIDGTVNGNISVGGAVGAVGSNAQAFIMTGNLLGSFTNKGSINASGTTTPSSTATNPEAGIGLGIGGNVTAGILNSGPTSPGDTTARGLISTSGQAQTILISPGVGGITPLSGITIGLYADATLGTQYSFINRGTISASPLSPNLNAEAFKVVGSSNTINVTFSGGLFNSGSFDAVTSNDATFTGSNLAAAVWIGNYATVPKIVNDKTESNQGVIAATVSGPKGGAAYAIRFDPLANQSINTSITNSGIISAVAATSDTTIGTLAAYGILDQSGTINFINNTGTISAQATKLDGNSQIAVAADLSANTTGVTFLNGTGSTVVGDVDFGSGNDTFTIIGAAGSGNTSQMVGDLNFGGGAGTEQLTIGNYATVTGALNELLGSSLNVEVMAQGTLNLTNGINGASGNNFNVNSNIFTVHSGGTLGIALSQAFDNSPFAIIDASSSATLETNSTMKLTFGSFLTVTGNTAEFILIDTPLNQLSVDLAQLRSQVCTSTTAGGDIPFFFKDGASCLNTVVNASTNHSELVLSLIPKTRDELGLVPGTFGYQLFPYVNKALALDDELGAGIINGINSTDDAKAAYAAFAPDVTGSSRAIAIALTDQATGPVAARQRALRMYAAQQGSVTMWGQEFVQRLNESGNAAGGQFRNTGFGFALGLDGGDPFDGRYGGAFTFYSGDTSEQAPRDSKTTSEWYMLTGYSDWRGKGLFFDSQVSFGYGALTGTRRLNIGGVSRVASDSRKSLLLAGGFTTGVVFAGGGTVFTPQFSVDGLTMREDGYTEVGGGKGFDLSVQPYYAQSLRGYLGASLRQDLNFGDFYLQPEARVGYRYDFLNDPARIKASFPSVVPISQFTLTGPDPGKGNLVAGGSISTTTGAWSIGLNYDFLRAQDGSTSQTGTISLIGRI
ncbi:MAG: autotransporter outer membrane beta-barrel domain-containing protein [Proteobacteria bacterium]|nr:autotransporter outer membrane beta-barrel domain-containing protein [Pseudomonadota bacterium]